MPFHPIFRTPLSNRWKLTGACLVAFLIIFWLALPHPLFNDPTSLVIQASNGQLMGARIAADGQWRFPASEIVPEKFATAIVTFEDKRFFSHWGVDPLAMGRAVVQNIKSRKIVSGGSTLSMQVIRLARRGKPRTITQKLIELFLAFRLEAGFSKKEILSLYASNAPFGGNVVGLEAASWRYFGKGSSVLSWAEAATLAVLPNAPSIIHPGRNRGLLEGKRNKLLEKMYKNGDLDSLQYELALSEPLPLKPLPLPQDAPHLLDYMASISPESRIVRTSIDFSLQKRVNDKAAVHHQLLSGNEVYNLAVIVMDVATKKVLAYVGNAPNTGTEHGRALDIIQAPRSTGSILKPILYSLALQDGQILPQSMLSDIPTYLKDYRPENYLNTYDGVVPANIALSKSLNIPFVRLLRDYGIEKFHYDLKKLGISTLSYGPDHYGLSLILGGSEAKLWDLTNIYCSMAHRLGNFYNNQGWYEESDFDQASFFHQENEEKSALAKVTSFPTADVIWLTFDAMKKLERPTADGQWERFDSKKDIAWKTGTSYGFRDAWAIGVNKQFAVGVWVGNADGEGRPGLTGTAAAAPILFDLFDLLPASAWFDKPYDALKLVPVCRQSGYLPSAVCPADTQWVQKEAFKASQCSFHQLIHLDETGTRQVNSTCYPVEKMESKAWFVLPATEEHYYLPKHPNYRPLPPFLLACNQVHHTQNDKEIELIYPSFNARIYVPVDLNGQKSKSVFKAVHRNSNAILHWHIDKEYIGSTKEIHTLEISPTEGKHVLTLIDERGKRLEQQFEIIEKTN